MTKKKHYITTIADIKYCEEYEKTLYSELRGIFWKFENGVWCEFVDGVCLSYNVTLSVKDGLLYYEEELEEQTKATENDIGKLCWFWDEDEDDKQVSVLNEIRLGSFTYYSRNLGVCINCRPLTKEEIQEFMEKAE